jgi:uncharacterized protein
VRPLRTAPALAAALLLSGCSFLSPAADPSRFFVLNAVATGGGGPSSLTVGVGPIAIAAYLTAPEIQTRAAASEILRSPIDRWGEPLEDGLVRVLAQDLSVELGTADVVLFPWYAEAQPEVQVAATIRRFELEAGGVAVLEARYRVSRVADGGRAVSRDVAIRKEPQGSSTGASVAALSEALADLARELAREVRALR